MYNSRTTPAALARSDGHPALRRTAARSPEPEYDWLRLRQTYLHEPTDARSKTRWRNAFYNTLSGRAIADGEHERAIKELRAQHHHAKSRGRTVKRVYSRPLTDSGRDFMETLTPEAAGRYAAATYRFGLRPHEHQYAVSALQRDPNYLANRVAQQEVDNGASPGRVRQINRMRGRWEMDSHEGQALKNYKVRDADIDAAMHIFEPKNLDTHALQPWEHPVGPVANPMVDALDRTLKRHRFENADTLLPVTADLYRRVPSRITGGLPFPEFHHAVGQFLEGHNYKTERPEPAAVELSPEAVANGFFARRDSTPRQLKTVAAKTPEVREDRGKGLGGRLWGPLWTPENRPTEVKARNLTEFGRWLETESRARGVPVHPLAHELYRPSWQSTGQFPHGSGAITPNPDFYDTHLTHDFDLPFAVRTLDPTKDPSLAWHQRLRNTEWTQDEPRGLGATTRKGSTQEDKNLEPFDTELLGDRKVVTFGEIYHNPHLLVRDTHPVATRFRDEQVSPGITRSLPLHIMASGTRATVPGSPVRGASPLESPRLQYRVWNPGELASAHHIMHGNELYGHIYKALSDPTLDRDAASGSIAWTGKSPGGQRIVHNAKSELVHNSMNNLQRRMYNLSRGQTDTLVDGTEVKGHDLFSEHAGLADSLQKLVIPYHPEDTEHGNKLLRGLRGTATDNTLRGLIENAGSPATNIHKMGQIYDWKKRYNQALADNPDDPSLKLIDEGLKRHVPDFITVPGTMGKENIKNRNRDARIIISDVSGDIRRRSMMDKHEEFLKDLARNGIDEHEPSVNEHNESEDIDVGDDEEETFGGKKL